jgi:Protein of unknown function (DUF3237)
LSCSRRLRLADDRAVGAQSRQYFRLPRAMGLEPHRIHIGKAFSALGIRECVCIRRRLCELTDRVAILDVRTTLESRDGAVIAISYTGVADWGEDGYQRFLNRALPARVRLDVVPRCQTAHAAYQ